MVTRIVDTTRFVVEGRLIDWEDVFRDRPGEPVDVHVILNNLGLPVRMVHLRWAFNADTALAPPMGMPTEPFTVWQKPAITDFTKLPSQLHLVGQSIGADMVSFSWGTPATHVHVELGPDEFDVPVVGLSGGPGLDHAVTMTRGFGNTGAQLKGAALTGFLVPEGTTVLTATGLLPQDYVQDPAWTQVERVGLPVDPSAWTGPVAGQAQPQGLIGKLTTPAQAAVERLFRGMLLYGWDLELAPGVPAPPWQPPSPKPLVTEVNAELLPLLKPVLAGAPAGQILKRSTTPVSSPTNPAGSQMPGSQPSQASVSPLALLLTAVSTDPFLALALGFGTALEPPSDPGNSAVFNPAKADYLVTARYANGLSGKETDPVEYAALLLSPDGSERSPGPGHLRTAHLGLNRPTDLNGEWTASSQLSWDRLATQGLLAVRDFAAVRRVLGSTTPPVPLMEVRPSGGFRPIAANDYHPGKATSTRLTFADRVVKLPIDQDPVTTEYFVAQSDLFGRWSHWSRASCPHDQPPVQSVPILAAALTPTAPDTGTKCPATLTFQVSWDWTSRTPQQIRLVGRLYPAAYHGQSPADLTVPDVLHRSLGTGSQPLDLLFTGDTITVDGALPGATVEYLSEDGSALVQAGPAQGSSRRYRITVPGLTLDYSATGHIGAALWAAGMEQVSDLRKGEFSENPTVITASTPIAPVVDLEPVTLASLPDSTGCCHARIAWGPAPGATGYFLYTATESALLAAGPPDTPTASATLAERRAVLEDLFANHESRREFTRVNSTALQGTSIDVTLPRGSSDIHAYVVLGVNAGGIESDWPTPTLEEVPQKLILVAAPRVAVPLAPTLEVSRMTTGPGFGARVSVRSRPGARVERVDLHRVRVPGAAAEVDTMGPPVATIAASGAGWTVSRDTTGQLSVDGTDSPDGSWRRVYYRAVAWSGRRPARGLLGSRSPASPAANLVLPPASPPDLSEVTVLPAPNTAHDLSLIVSTAAPIEDTPLGPHRLSVEAYVSSLPAVDGPQLVFSSSLAAIPGGFPPPGAPPVVRVSDRTQHPVVFAALIRRATANDGVSAILRLTDPLGRITERLVTIPAGPDPDIANVTVAKVSDLGTELRWTTSIPVVPIASGAYRVRVTATPPTVGGKPGRPFSVELPVDKVPPDLGVPGPGDLLLRRAPGTALPHAFRAICRPPVATLTLRLTAPDGRTAEITRKVT